MNRSGFTLIELMIAVSLGGILVTSAYAGLGYFQRSSARALQEELALQVLEHEAAAHVHGMPPDPQVRGRLLSALPGGAVRTRRHAGHTILEVSWDREGARARRELAVIGVAR